MLFNSAIFLFFYLPLLVIIYFLIPKKMRNTLLLIFSIFFYFFSSVNFTLILLSSIVINFFIALLISGSKKKRFRFLLIGLLVNLGVLFYFKYLNFFLESILNPLRSVQGLPSLDLPTIVLPLALSFYTFHALSYLLDVYRNKVKATKNPLKLALYFLLFPHLIAGPIVRFGEISAYLNKRIQTVPDFSYGVTRFIVGLGKKVLIADTLGQVVDEVFAIPPQNMSWETAWLGIICFTLQIYFDFSGYSDMAIGLARMFGFKFPENFNYPYIASSIGEFWTRWHMTLYRWFRDYIYIPLGGNRCSVSRNYFNIAVVFSLTGLWHGADWNFIVWGILQALFIILEKLKDGILMRHLSPPLKHLYTLLAIVISWVFFRSDSLGYATALLKRLFLDFTYPLIEYRPFAFFINNERLLAILLGIIISTPLLQKLVEKAGVVKPVNTKIFRGVYQGMGYIYFLVLLIISMIFVAGQTYNPFIYFKF